MGESNPVAQRGKCLRSTPDLRSQGSRHNGGSGNPRQQRDTGNVTLEALLTARTCVRCAHNVEQMCSSQIILPLLKLSFLSQIIFPLSHTSLLSQIVFPLLPFTHYCFAGRAFFHSSVWTGRSTVILDHERNHDRRVAGTGQTTQSLPRTAGSLLELWVAGDVVDARRLHPGVQPTARSAPGDAELSVRALIQDW